MTDLAPLLDLNAVAKLLGVSRRHAEVLLRCGDIPPLCGTDGCGAGILT